MAGTDGGDTSGLASTGAGVGATVALALGLLVGGIAVLVAARRRVRGRYV
jgi:LPXTG-motif cell wall-anchored protein